MKEDTGFIGFKNMEQIAEHPLEENLAALRRLKDDYPDKVLIASIMGENEQQWEELARLVQEAGADMIECNFSCPQMTSHAMGSDVGQSPELVEKYCRAVKRGSTLPMLAKMTPNIGDMCEVALAARAAAQMALRRLTPLNPSPISILIRKSVCRSLTVNRVFPDIPVKR